MAKNKKKKFVLKLKKGEELRQELVLEAPIPAAPTSPSPSSSQGNSTYNSSGSCAAKSSHCHGKFGPNYEEFEDSDEEDEEFGSYSCKEDEAHASKFFFSSPMYYKGAKYCLVVHESHAHFSSQEGEGAAAFLSRGADGIPPLLLSARAAPLVAPPHSSPSNLKDREHGGCDGVTEVPARGKNR